MQVQKKYLLPVAVLGIVASAFAFSSAAKADAVNFQDSLVQKLVSRFNLNETEVKQVVGEHRDQMHKEREASHETRLQALVDGGKLTQSQRDAFVTKMRDMKAQSISENMSEEERQKAHETHQREMDSWFAEQGIDKDLLKGASHSNQGYHHTR